jgi:hypothetical protein
MALDPSSPSASPELPIVIPVNIPASADRPILLPTQVASGRSGILTIAEKTAAYQRRGMSEYSITPALASTVFDSGRRHPSHVMAITVETVGRTTAEWASYVVVKW